jgi:hypothetical protein
MKRLNAYGGRVLLWNVGGGWYWHARSPVRTLSPPRKLAYVKGKNGEPVYLHSMGSNGEGQCATLAVARRHAVNLLKSAAS